MYNWKFKYHIYNKVKIMTKKTYKQPTAKAVRIATNTLLAGSDVVRLNDEEVDDTQKGQASDAIWGKPW